MLKDNIEELVERHKALYNGTKGALIYIPNIKETRKMKKPLVGDYNMPNGWKDFIKDSFDCYIQNYQARAFIDDDQVPSIRPRLGIQEHSSFISGNNQCQVDFMGDTSFHHQMIFSPEDLDSLYISEENEYFKLLDDCYNYLNELAKDQCAVALRGTNLELDIANTIRGNELLFDFYDNPEWTDRLMNFSNEAAKWYTNHQLNWATKVYGGYVTGFGVWMEGNSVGHLAEDGTCLIGPDLYEEFCLKYTTEFLSHYDGCYMHLHSVAYKSIPIIVKNPKVKVVELCGDPNSYTAMQVFKMYEKELQGKVICLDSSFAEIKENVEFLKDKKIIIQTNAKTIDEAKEMINWVRNNLPVE